MKKIIVILICTWIAGVLIYNFITHKTIKTEFPISSIELKPNFVLIHVDKKAKLDDVINTDLFEGINPKMNEDSVISQLGKPNDRSKKQGFDCLVYYTKNGRIEYGNDSGTLADNSDYSTNVLSFYREDIPKRFIFKASTIKYLPENMDGVHVAVEEDGGDGLTISFSKKEGDWIQWSHEIYYHPPTE